MSQQFERGQTVVIIRRRSQGRKQTYEGTIKSAGPKWVVIEYSLESGYQMTDIFDATTRCLKNFGNVKTFATVPELAAFIQEA